MTAQHYQVAIIGGGPGGYIAALRSAQLGLSTICIDERSTLGGTCLNVGCIPSKTLLHTSELYQVLQHGQKLGITAPQAQVDFNGMMQHKDEVVAGLVQGVAALFKRHGIVHLTGKARFADAHHLVIQGAQEQTINADNIILATGSEPIALPFAPFDERRILSSTGALWLPKVPAKMVVIGAGAIGVELASVYRRLGSSVVVIEMLDHICPGQDSTVRHALQRSLEKQGLVFHLKSRLTAVDSQEAAIDVRYQSASGKEETLTADALLVSVGRRPYTAGLNLEAAGIQLAAKGYLTVDDHFRTAASHIYAIGDLITGPGLAHRASEEGIAVAQIIAGKTAHLNYMAIPNVIYTAPEVAAVGMTEEQARAHGLAIEVGIAHFRGNARARCTDELEGFVKIIGDKRSKRLLGMHILGAHASELIATGTLAMTWGATVDGLADAVYAHPTLSETIKEAALHALGRPLHA